MMGPFMSPERLRSSRTSFRRPAGASVGRFSSNGAGLPEDNTVAEPRYQLAKVLDVDEFTIPTNAVSYSFPEDMWIPVQSSVDAEKLSSLKLSPEGRFILAVEGDEGAYTEKDITADDDRQGVGLQGRITEDWRPLACYNRAGTPFIVSEYVYVFILEFD